MCRNKDKKGIKEIVDGFNGTDKAIQNDCIKVLYEIGDRNPELISDYADDFISGLNSRNNRLVWGCMTALSKIAEIAPAPLFEKLPLIIDAHENGSVITVDNSISVFAGLCKANDKYSETVLPIIIKHLQKCRPKDVPQHAERASICFNNNNADAFTEVLEIRLPHLVPTGQARVNKLLKKLKNKQI